jgi:hypothetical protein
MKTAIKVLNIISMVSGIIGIISLIISAIVNFAASGVAEYPEIAATLVGSGVGSLVGAAFCIVPVILALKVNKAVEEAYSKDQLTVWGIVCLLLVNTISGILIFCLPETDFPAYRARMAKQRQAASASAAYTQARTVAPAPQPQAAPQQESIDTKLKNLKNLYEQEVITKEEYDECRKKLLSKY